jgi:hypothetical protein
MSYALYQPKILTSISVIYLHVYQWARTKCYTLSDKGYAFPIITTIEHITGVRSIVLFTSIVAGSSFFYSMNEILPFERSYFRLILTNFHFMLKSIKNYSFCVKLEPATILVNKTMDLTPVICSIVVWGKADEHYVRKLVSDSRQVGGFLLVLRCPPPIQLTATI